MLSLFWDRPAFSVHGVDFLWLDVALGAMARGQWPAFERRLAEGLACAARADLENVSPSQDELDAAATAFRYERDLISAADVTAWLERTGLSAEDWIASLSRDLLRERWSHDLEDVLDRFAPSARQLLAAAVGEGICSGVFDKFEQGFAGRAAFVFENDPVQFQRACRRDDAHQTVDVAVTRLAQTHAHWLEMRPAADTTQRLSAMLQLEAAFDLLVNRATSSARLTEIVDTNRLEWLRLELDTVSFSTEAAAREAILCVREDGLSLYDVAALSHRLVDRTTIALEDVDVRHREQLLAAEPGRVLGPLAVDGRFELTTLISRSVPVLADPTVAARARQALVDAALQHAARDHVTRRIGN
jgi:hypothetical protein